jgi:hypothetical protein
MTVGGALAGGAVGAAVLASGLRIAQELGWTRMDIPFLLGTIFTERRRPAAVIGYVSHIAIGLIAALVYAGIFEAVGEASWWFGLALGVVHASVAGGALTNLLLPAVHPRMGTPWTDAEETPLLEPPGFMLSNYGRSTMAVTLVLHLAYGAIVGAFAAGF